MSAAVVSLRQQRCVNHPLREASARCPECSRFYCRECITEHDGRVLCAVCLDRIAQRAESHGSRWTPLLRLGLVLVSFAIVLIMLLVLGNLLLSVPAQFHKTGGW